MSRDEPPGGAGGAGGSGAGGSGGGEKADRHMRRALDDAAPEDELQAIVTVKGAAAPAGTSREGAAAEPGDPAAPPDPAPPHPKDFPDRVAYRQAMIEHHGKNPRARVGAAKEALEKLGLTTRGEGHAGLLVVQGPAGRLAHALELEAVERVALDRHVGPRGAERGAQGPEVEAGVDEGVDEGAEGEAGGEDALGLPSGGPGSKDC